MNKQELSSIIRTIVREEVEKALPNVLTEILAAKIAEQSPAQRPLIERTSPQPQQRPQSGQRKRPMVELDGGMPLVGSDDSEVKKFSNNPIFNQILSETRGGIPQSDTGITSDSVLDNIDENNPVASALTRDYRSLMRGIDKKRGN